MGAASVTIFRPMHTSLGLAPPVSQCRFVTPSLALWWSLQLQVSISQGPWRKHLLTFIHSLSRSPLPAFPGESPARQPWPGSGFRAEWAPGGDEEEGERWRRGGQACPVRRGHRRWVMSPRGIKERRSCREVRGVLEEMTLPTQWGEGSRDLLGGLGRGQWKLLDTGTACRLQEPGARRGLQGRRVRAEQGRVGDSPELRPERQGPRVLWAGGYTWSRGTEGQGSMETGYQGHPERGPQTRSCPGSKPRVPPLETPLGFGESRMCTALWFPGRPHRCAATAAMATATLIHSRPRPRGQRLALQFPHQ